MSRWLEAWSSITLSLFFAFASFSYLLWKGKTLKSIIEEFGLSRSGLTLKMLLMGIVLFFAIVLLQIILTVFQTVTGIQLPTNVSVLLAGTPLYFLIFTFLIAPINEEIFFRGFLINRAKNFFKGSGKANSKDRWALWFGIIVSAIIFGALHIDYLSVSEFVAAFVFGILAGYVFTKTKSLYPSIIAHIVVNFLTIISLLYLGMLIHF